MTAPRWKRQRPAGDPSVAAGIVCFWACTAVKSRSGYDDSLDAFGVHGVGGTLSALLTGVFAVRACMNIDGTNPSGWIEGESRVFVGQIVVVIATWLFAIVMTSIILKVLDLTRGLRVPQEGEMRGLDLS